MRYLSPSFLFGETLRPPFDRKTVQLEKKKLLAELELGDGGTLDIRGESFTRSDLLNYFEDLQKDEVAAYHTAIWQDPVLLSFLQDSRLDEGQLFRGSELYDRPDFIAWISSYFHQSFTTFVTSCFDRTDETGMQTLLANKLLMTNKDTEEAWLFVSKILTRNIALFDHYKDRVSRKSPRPMPVSRIAAFVGDGYIRVIRQLPDSRFAHFKNMYAFSMQHPAISMFNWHSSKRSLAITWIESAGSLAVSEEIKESIAKKLEELNGIVKRENKRKPWVVVWIIVLAIKGVATCNDSINDRNSTPAPVYFRPSPDTLLREVPGKLPDSIVTRSFPPADTDRK